MAPPDGTAALKHAPPTGTLAQAAALFFRAASPRLLTSLAGVAWAARLAVPGWGEADAVVAAGILAWWPFQEWLIHVGLLHWRPRRMLGVWVDPFVARKHRAHHQDPWNLEILFIPLRSTLASVPVLAALFGLTLPLPTALTALAVYLSLSVHYEWIHFLVHTRYVPRGGWYRRLWRSHRLHHCKNEHYWYGVGMLTADRVLGTSPVPASVPTSETVRTLGLENALADA